MFATAYCLPWAWSSLRNEFVSLPFVGGLGVLGFVVSGVLGKARANRPAPEPLSTPPTDLTLRGDSGRVVGEDGRRWRTGSP